MSHKDNWIELTEEIAAKIQSGDVVAVAIAEAGAMGDPGSIELVDTTLKMYRTHFGELPDKAIVKMIPFVTEIELGFGDVAGLNDSWTWLYLGFGNYLFVRPGMDKKLLKYIEDNYSDTKFSKTVELYAHWYEGLKKLSKK